MEHWSFHSKNVIDAWDILEWLVGGTYKFGEVGFASGMSFLDPCVFNARSYNKKQFMESYAPAPQSLEYASAFCASRQSSDNDTNSHLM